MDKPFPHDARPPEQPGFLVRFIRSRPYLLGALMLGVAVGLLVGVMYCFHYAHLYYTASKHTLPLEFPDQHTQPNYWDFLYFSFTLSVAVQTSDVTVKTRAMRKLVLGHCVLAFFFNLVILGLSVNIAASLVNS
jgi:uncharacterized membrane protein